MTFDPKKKVLECLTDKQFEELEAFITSDQAKFYLEVVGELIRRREVALANTSLDNNDRVMNFTRAQGEMIALKAYVLDLVGEIDIQRKMNEGTTKK